MKTVAATAGSIGNKHTVMVEMPQYNEADKLTPDMARSAARLAFGHTIKVLVSDDESAYRLDGDKCRKA